VPNQALEFEALCSENDTLCQFGDYWQVRKEREEAEKAQEVACNFRYTQGLMNPVGIVERTSTKGRIAAFELHATSIAADESNTAKV
jgi:hypothetical protein